MRRVLLALGCLAALAIVVLLALLQFRSVRSGPGNAPTPACMPNCPPSTPSGAMAPVSSSAWAPDKVTDLSPELALFYKVTILVQHADGSLEEFWLAPDITDEFREQLPAGDKLVFVDAPHSSMDNEAPTGEP